MPLSRFAYVTNDSSLYSCALDESGATADARCILDCVTEGRVFSWPCWAPAGDGLVVSATGRGEGGAGVELWHVTHADGVARTIHAQEEPGAELIAAGLAHYPYWSPGGRALTLVAHSGSGLALSIVDAAGQIPARTLVEGAPIFSNWAGDGRALVVHRGAELTLFDLAGSESTPRNLLQTRATFRAPAWTLDGSAVIYAAPRAGGGNVLWRVERSSEERDAIMELQGAVALVRDPSSNRLLATTIDAGDSEPQRLELLDTDAGTQRTLERGPISAAFWAPDGAAAYFFEPIVGSAALSLFRRELQGEGRRLLARFQPSREFATLIAFYDQFALSHAIVSPDGRWVMFSGLALHNGGAGRGALRPQNGCYVVRTDGTEAPQRVAAGDVGFFAPSVGE